MKPNTQENVSSIASAVDVLRADIDRIDDQILDLLEQRYPLVKRIAKAKNIEGGRTLALRPGRERAIVDRLSARASHVPDSDVRQIWRSILSLSAKHQRDYHVILWGPASARLTLSTLAAARYGDGVTISWAASEEAAWGAAQRGEAILMVVADRHGWLEQAGLDLIDRLETGCDQHPWVLELGRVAGDQPWDATRPPAGDRWRWRAPLTGTVAYLGGAGSHSEEACRRVAPACGLMPLGDLAAVVQAVREGSADLAVVPVSNSMAGAIPSVRELLSHPELRIVGEEVVPIRQHLLGVPGARIEDVRTVTSHPAALIQSEPTLSQWPWARTEAASTSAAAMAVAAAADSEWAAIGSEAAAAAHGLVVLAWDLQGETENLTRFAVIERRDTFA